MCLKSSLDDWIVEEFHQSVGPAGMRIWDLLEDESLKSEGGAANK